MLEGTQQVVKAGSLIYTLLSFALEKHHSNWFRVRGGMHVGQA